MFIPRIAAVTMLFGVSFSITACGGEDENAPVNEPGAGERVEAAAEAAGGAVEQAGATIAEGAETIADTVGDVIAEEAAQANALGLTVRNILDEQAKTRDGRIAARVSDIMFAPDGRPVLALLSEGGFLGQGRDDVIVTIQRLVIQETADGELVVEVNLSNEEIEKLADDVSFLPTDFSVGSNIDASLLSARKLLDAPIYNVDARKVADVHDLALDARWRIESVVVSVGGVGEFGDKLTAAPWPDFELSDDRSALTAAGVDQDFDEMAEFQYRRPLR